MRRIQAFQCADGTIHNDEDKAKAHDADLLGAELDGLLKLFAFNGGQITRNDEYKAICQLSKRKDELEQACSTILSILNHGEYEEY